MLPKYRPPTHPGEMLLKEFLEPLGLTQTQLAKHLGWTQTKVNEIARGRRGVTPETALAFAQVFGTSADFWLNLQQNHDLWQAQRRVTKTYRRISAA